MDLAPNYKFQGQVRTTRDRARALVWSMRAAASEMKETGRLEEVGRISSSPAHLAWLSAWLSVPVPAELDTIRGIGMPAQPE